MRCLERNKQKFYYALYVGKTPIYDSQGNPTFETQITYGTPIEMHANISGSKGEADMQLFGNEIAYDKTIVTDDMSCPIDENTVLYIDVSPTDHTYNYIVKKVAKTLNSISYAISKVESMTLAQDND